MGARARVVRMLAVVAFAVGVPVLAWCGSAAAKLTHPYVLTFGAFSNVQGVAVQSSSGDVFVYDGGKGEVLKFDASGSPVNFSSTGTNAISGVGYASSDEGEIAVDSSSGPAKGDIYVAHADGTVNIYSEAGTKLGELTSQSGKPWGEACGVAVDTSGNVYVGLYGEHVNKYVPVANPVTNANYAASIGGLSSVCNVAADSVGNVFSDKWSSGPVTRYEPAQFGSLSATGSVVDKAGSTLAVDPANDEVYVDERNQIAQFGAHGMPFEAPVMTFAGSGSGAISGSLGVAVSGFNHEVYVSNGKGGLSVFGPAVLVPTVTTGGASNIKASSATVSGTVNPENIAVTSCTFEYGETTAYGHSESCAESPAQIGSGGQPVEVHANLTSLNSAVYHYRLVVANANGSSAGADASFSTIPPAVEEEFVTDVAGTSATLHGQVNPKGSDTTYRFEYGPTASYGSSTAARNAGSGSAAVLVEAHVQELLQSTSYHYRLVATSAAGTTNGLDQTFTTQGIGGQLTLLDGRQWEEVSPQEKHGATIEPESYEGGVIQAAEDGNAIAYLANNAIDAEPESNRATLTEQIQILARRTAGGWANKAIDTPQDEVAGAVAGYGVEYKMFTPDLLRSIVGPVGSTPLAEGVTERTAYLRDEPACEAGLSSCYAPFLTPADTKPGAKWAEGGIPVQPRVVGASGDLSHVVIHSVEALTSDAPGVEKEGYPLEGLYEWSGGQLRLVSVQPQSEGGKSVGGELGREDLNVRNAVSSDGARVVWKERCGRYCDGPLYLTDTARGETIRLDPVGDQLGSTNFEIATADDSRVFFNADIPGHEEALYVCDVVEVAGKLVCNRGEVASQVTGVLGMNETGTSVYFTSNASLVPGTKQLSNGKGANLYVARFDGSEWKPRLIAVLSQEDWPDWAAGGSELNKMTASVSPDGRFAAFMSERSLTGYDNLDVASGQPDEEVFLYDDSTGRLACASCDPTGARPHGVFDTGFTGEGSAIALRVDREEVWRQRWIAANVPGWDPITLGQAVRQPRYLSASGQLFFNSSDSLVPQDTNGQQDVYEFEPAGVGGCTSTASSYSERSGGCVDLLSSAGAGDESVFVDANASATDVFFLTSARLTSQDQDTAYDVYDAHVCSASVPCVQQPVSPPLCNSGDSCKGPPTPQPSIFGVPASATFSGQGNVRAAQTGSVRSRSLTRAQRLARALRACRRRNPHYGKRLRVCERRARRAYGRTAHNSGRTSRVASAPRAAKSGQNGRGR